MVFTLLGSLIERELEKGESTTDQPSDDTDSDSELTPERTLEITSEGAQLTVNDDDGSTLATGSETADGEWTCGHDDCEDDDQSFDTAADLSRHVRNAHTSSESDADADADDEEVADGAGGERYDARYTSTDRLYRLASYPDHIPNTKPDEDGLEASVRHNWRILTNSDDPGGLDWFHWHLDFLYDYSENTLTQAMSGVGLAGTYYLKLNRSLLEWTYGEFENFARSGTDFARSGAKGLIGLAAWSQVVAWPGAVALRAAGVTGLMQYIPLEISRATISSTVATSGILSGIGATSALMAAAPALTVSGLLGYFMHEGFRETLRSAAGTIKQKVASAARSVTERLSDWFGAAESTADRAAADASAAASA